MTETDALAKVQTVLESPREREDQIVPALKGLRSRYSREAVETLFRALTHPVWGVRKEAAQVMETFGEQAIPILSEKLSQANPDQEYWACQILARLGGSAVAVLDKLYTQGPKQARLNVINALAGREEEDGLDILVNALDDPEWPIRKAAAGVLVARPDKTRVADAITRDLDPTNPNRVFWGIIVLFKTIGKKSLGLLEKLANTGDPKLRYTALQALASLEMEPALGKLLQTLEDPSPLMRERVIALVARFGARAARDIKERLPRMSGASLTAGLVALSRVDVAQAITQAKALLGDPSEDRRYATMEALGEMNQEEAIEGLVTAFSDPSWTLRRRAYDRLARFGDRAIPYLYRSLFHRDADVRYWAMRGLARLGNQGLKPLLEAFERGGKEDRSSVLEAIGEEDPPDEALAFLVQALDDPIWNVRKTAATLLQEQRVRCLKHIVPPSFLDEGNKGYWCRKVLKELKPQSADRVLQFVKKRDLQSRKALVFALEKLDASQLDAILDQGNDQLIKVLDTASPALSRPPGEDRPLDLPQPPPEAKGLEPFLAPLHKTHAQSLHLIPGSPPALRKDGRLHFIPGPTVDRELVEREVLSRVGPEKAKDLAERRSLAFTFPGPDAHRYKAFVHFQGGVPAAVLAPIGALPLLDEEIARSLFGVFGSPCGLHLVSGAPWSGSTTLLGSILDWFNRHQPVHVISIERLIEHCHECQIALVSQVEIGADVPTAAEGVRLALRRGADVIVIEDLPDPETLQAALEAAELGRTVIAGIEAGDVELALARSQDLLARSPQKPSPHRFHQALSSVTHQILLPRLDGRGMVPVREVLQIIPPVREALRRGSLQEIEPLMRSSQSEGMMPRDKELMRLVYDGLVSYEQARHHARDSRSFTLDRIFPEG